MDIDIENVDKLKVAELRALLSSHELDTKGTKPILVARLKSYLESLPQDGSAAPTPVKSTNTSVVEASEEAEDDEEGKLFCLSTRNLIFCQRNDDNSQISDCAFSVLMRNFKMLNNYAHIDNKELWLRVTDRCLR